MSTNGSWATSVVLLAYGSVIRMQSRPKGFDGVVPRCATIKMRHHKDAPEGQKGPVPPDGISLVQQLLILRDELCPAIIGQRLEHRPGSSPRNPAKDRIRAGQHVQVGRLPGIHRAP